MLEGVPPALEAEQHSVLDGYTTLALKNISYEEEQQQQQQQQQQQDLSYGEAQQQQQQKQDLSYEEAQQQQQQQQQQREEEEEHEGGVWSVHSKEGRAHSDRSPEGALALSSSHELRSVTMVCVFVVGLGVGVGVWVRMGVGVCLCLWWVGGCVCSGFRCGCVGEDGGGSACGSVFVFVVGGVFVCSGFGGRGEDGGEGVWEWFLCMCVLWCLCAQPCTCKVTPHRTCPLQHCCSTALNPRTHKAVPSLTCS